MKKSFILIAMLLLFIFVSPVYAEELQPATENLGEVADVVPPDTTTSAEDAAISEESTTKETENQVVENSTEALPSAEATGETDKKDVTKETEASTIKEKEETPEAEEKEDKDKAVEDTLSMPEDMARVPMMARAPMANKALVRVNNLEALINAIANATDPTTILITQGFEIDKTILIDAGKNITITAIDPDQENQVLLTPVGIDVHVTLPEDDDSQATRKALVEQAKAQGERAIEETTLADHPLSTAAIVLKRAQGFTGTLFRVAKDGVLNFGQRPEDPFLIDGNGEEVMTKLQQIFVEVRGIFHFNGGILTNAHNEHGNSAPVYVGKAGEFTLNGGRITNNHNVAYMQRPDGSWEGSESSVGGVYVAEGGKFLFQAGSIDNNTAITGGVFVGGGVYFNKNNPPAVFDMQGGYITNNKPVPYEGRAYLQNIGGGVQVNSNAVFNFNDGIIAGNVSEHGGGIGITDNYVTGFDGVSYSETKNMSYDEYIANGGKADFTMEGGLLYQNTARVEPRYANATGVGGGVYINASTVNFQKGYLLENVSGNMGGGIYVSIVPHTLKLAHTLVTDNNAVSGNYYAHPAGYGGGYWNCPVGIVRFDDGHSLYIFDNNAVARFGKDITTIRKKERYTLNNKVQTFLTSISPLTEKGNVIKYFEGEKEIPTFVYQTSEAVSLNAQYDEKLIDEAWTNSTLFIIGNTALKGGGIGSNAHIVTPGTPGDYQLKITKKWASSIEAGQYPDEVRIDLLIGKIGLDINALPDYADAETLYKYGEVVLNADNNWQATMTELPTPESLAEKGLRYYVKEAGNKFYADVTETDTNSNKKQVQITRHWLTDENFKDYEEEPNSDQYVKFIYQDKDGADIGSQILRLSPGKWSATLDRAIVESMDALTLGYTGTDKPPYPNGWDGFFGFPAYSYDDTDPDMPTGYVKDLGNDKYEIQLPFIWTQYRSTDEAYSFDYNDNVTGYRVALVDQDPGFVVTNYPPTELVVEKEWDAKVKKDSIPENLKIYLLLDNKRVKDANGNDVAVILNEGNHWLGKFTNLPPFERVARERYTFEEDVKGFTAENLQKVKQYLTLKVNRDSFENYEVQKDYTGGTSRIIAIPIEIHVDGKVYKSDIKNYLKENSIFTELYGMFENIPLASELSKTVKTYYDADNKPFPRNLGKFKTAQDDIIENEGAYIFKLVKEGEQYVLYVPKLTGNETERNLFELTTSVKNQKVTIIHNRPSEKPPSPSTPSEPKSGDKISVEKIWRVQNMTNLPEIKVYLLRDGKNVLDEAGQPRYVILNAANGWKGSFDSLPSFQQAPYDSYSVEEEMVNGYIPQVIKNDSNGFSIINRPYLHDIIVSKIWQTTQPNTIPKELKVNLNGRTILLTPENNWRYSETDIEGRLGEDVIEEEVLALFDGDKRISRSLQFVSNDHNGYKIQQGDKILTLEDFQKLIQEGNYQFEYVDTKAVDGNYVVMIQQQNDKKVIQIPLSLKMKEVLEVQFVNVEKPPKTPPVPPTPPEEHHPPIPPTPNPPSDIPMTGDTNAPYHLWLFIMSGMVLALTGRRRICAKK